MTALFIGIDGTEKEVIPKDGKHFSLVELQAFVGGYIQVIQLSDGNLLVLNEEGKITGLPFNERATQLTEGAGLQVGDVIVGNVLVTPAEFIQ